MKELSAKELESVSGGVSVSTYVWLKNKLEDAIYYYYKDTEGSRDECERILGLLNAGGGSNNQSKRDATRDTVLRTACNCVLKGEPQEGYNVLCKNDANCMKE